MAAVIFGVILFFIVLKWDVSSDYKKWLDKVPVNHTKDAVIRAILLLPSLLLLTSTKLDDPVRLFDFIEKILITGGLMFSVWWELFDGIYNKLRGFKWRFNGTIDPDDALLDKFLYKIGDFWEGVLKIGLIALFLSLYIFIK